MKGFLNDYQTKKQKINNANLNKNIIKTFNEIENLINEEITSEQFEKTISNIKIGNIEEKNMK